jgi:hypothetical protein
MRYMDPAWRVTYLIEGRDAEGMLTSWRWEGELDSERHALQAPQESDPPSAMGRVTITCWQPYKKAALEDSHRAVLDLCGVLGVSIGGPFVEPVLPPIDVEGLAGAKSTGGIGISDSVSFALTQQIGDRGGWFAAVERVADDPAVRADIDTFLVAKRETDRATRALNLYRIYDRYTRELLFADPPLLEDEQVGAATTAALSALPEDIGSDERNRLDQAIRNSLSRVRRRPRLDILHEQLKDAVDGNPISRELLARIDSRRGRVAHNPTVLQEAGADAEADTMLFALVHVLLKRRLGL